MGKFSIEERREIITYGIARGKSMLIVIGITILLGGIFGSLYQSIEFLIVFCLLRRYAGGYHADSRRRCYLISFLAVFFSLLCIKYVECSKIFCFFLQTTCLLIMFFISPVENKNRKLEDCELIKYRRKTRTTAIALYVLSSILYCNFNINIIYPIVIAFLLVTILLILGCIKNSYENKQSFSIL